MRRDMAWRFRQRASVLECASPLALSSGQQLAFVREPTVRPKAVEGHRTPRRWRARVNPSPFIVSFHPCSSVFTCRAVLSCRSLGEGGSFYEGGSVVKKLFFLFARRGRGVGVDIDALQGFDGRDPDVTVNRVGHLV